MLPSKISYYGVTTHRNRKQHTIINGVSSSVLSIPYGVPQESILGALLFLIYTNDLNQCESVFKLNCASFADDTNLLYSNSSLKSINKYKNHDLKLIVHWL